MVVGVEGGNLIRLLPQHKEDRLKEVDQLGEQVDVLQADLLEGQRRAVFKGRPTEVKDVRPPPVEHQKAVEEVGVPEAEKEVVADEERLQAVRLAAGHEARDDEEGEQKVGGEDEGEGREGVANEEEVTCARVAGLVPVLA